MINVAYTVDDNYSQPFMASVISLLTNARQEVFINVFSSQSPSNIKKTRKLLRFLGINYNIIETSHNSFLSSSKTNVHGQESTAIYLRVFLAELLPHTSRLIYLDADTLIRGDLSELWETDLQGCIIAASSEASRIGKVDWCKQFSGGYFNSGVMLLDLGQWRQLNTTQLVVKAIRYYEENDVADQFWDQSPLNMTFQSNWTKLLPKWNCSIRTGFLSKSVASAHYKVSESDFNEMLDDPVIYHFLGAEKPWKQEFKYLNRFFVEYQTYLKVADFVASL